MEKKREYMTVLEQIEKMKKEGLVFENEEEAYEILTIYGKHNVIDNYNEHYLIAGVEEICYRDGVAFEQIFSLFTLDHFFKSSFIMAMLDVEEIMRGALSEVVSKYYGQETEKYLKHENYEKRLAKKPYNSLNSVLNRARKILNRIGESDVPPWKLFSKYNFFELLDFIYHLKDEQKSYLVQLIYGVDENTAKRECMLYLLDYTLLLCREYRNLAAHSSPIYNHKIEHEFKVLSSEDREYLRIIYDFIDAIELNKTHGVALLINLLKMFAYAQPYIFVNEGVSNQVKRHCGVYADDIPYLEEFLGGTIEMTFIEE